MGLRAPNILDKEEEKDLANPLAGGSEPISKPEAQPNKAPQANAAAPTLGGSKESADITGAPAPSAGGQAKTPGQGTSSGRFVSLQKYMSANKPNRMVGALQQKIGGELTGARGELTKQGETFNKAVGESVQQSGAVTKAAGEAVGALSTIKAPEQVIAQPKALEDYTKDIQAAQGLEYKGPTELSSYSALSNQAGKLSDLSSKSKTEEGQGSILSNYLTGPKTSAGASRLDLLGLQSSKDALRKLAQAGAEGKRFGVELGSEQGRITNEAKAQQDAIQASKDKLGIDLSKAQSGLQGEMNTGISNAQAAQQQEEGKAFTTQEAQDQFKQLMKAQGMSDDTIKNAITRVNWGEAIKPGGLLSRNIQDINEQNFNQDALNKKAALLRLQGKGDEADALGQFQEVGGPSYSAGIDLGQLGNAQANSDAAKLGGPEVDEGYIAKHKLTDQSKKDAVAGKPGGMNLMDKFTSQAQKEEAYKEASKQLKFEITRINQAAMKDINNVQAQQTMRILNAAKSGKPADIAAAKAEQDRIMKPLYYGKLADKAYETEQSYRDTGSSRATSEAALANILGKYYQGPQANTKQVSFGDVVNMKNPQVMKSGGLQVK